jgi:hypothetical protein
MNANYAALFTEFETEYETIKGTITDNLALCVKMIQAIEKKLKEIHKGLKKHQFENLQEEIYFFKELKPKLVSKLIYYKSIYKLEAGLTPVKKNKIKLYEKELRKIQQYTVNNKEFHEYYRSRSCYRDEEYFVRCSYKDIIRNDCFLINYHSKLCTSHDYNVAIFIANDMLVDFIENKLDELNGINTSYNNQSINKITWTGTKVDMTELIYGLHIKKMFNDGNCDINEIAKVFCNTFNIVIEDKDLYRCKQDIKRRNPINAKFLRSLFNEADNKFSDSDF